MTRRDKKGVPVFAAEGAIGDHIRRNRDKAIQTAFVQNHIDPGFVFFRCLRGQIREIEPGGGIDFSIFTDADAIGTAIGSPVKKHLCTGRIDGAVGL